MGLFSSLAGWFGNNDTVSSVEATEINPANGLPMIGGMGGVDVAGNPYGIDSSATEFDDFTTTSHDVYYDNSYDSFDSGGFGGFGDNY
ncbi:hypothetical protein [Thiomicrospira microaerophila]|uniref:hypothetical protein n=1 Tax=Thiomicrospira microaerophila TaxID=406020 RepID=UPI0005C870ED|nr:hypothetical protein [Thiomicrospira microaerophila]